MYDKTGKLAESVSRCVVMIRQPKTQALKRIGHAKAR